MTQESQVLDPYAIVLADLRAKRAQIDAAIKAIEDLTGGGASRSAESATASHSSPVPSEGPGAFLGMTVVEATKKLLASRRQAMSNSDIVPALERGGVVLNSADKLNTVGSILTRRFNNVGDIVRVSRGTWGLQEWYGSRNFRKRAAKEEPQDAMDEPEEVMARIIATEAESNVRAGRPLQLDEPDPWSPIDGQASGVFR